VSLDKKVDIGADDVELKAETSENNDASKFVYLPGLSQAM
jgi:hypothetical protein